MSIISNLRERGLTYGMVFLVLGLFVFGIYATTVESNFSGNDIAVVRGNENLRNISNSLNVFTKEFEKTYDKNFRFYRPVQLVGHIFEHSLWQYDAQGYHIVNIIIHLFTALALYWFLQLLFGDVYLAFLASIFFLIHPIHTNAVSYITHRGSMLGAGFLIAAFIGYVKGTLGEDKGDYMMAIFCYMVALFSHEGAVIFPLLLLMYHLFLKRRMHIKEFSVITVLSLAYIFLRIAALGADFTGPYPAAVDYFSALVSGLQFLIVPLGFYRGSKDFIHAGWLDFKVVVGVALFLIMLIYMFKRRGRSLVTPFMGGLFLVGTLTYFTSCFFAPFDIGVWSYLSAMAFCTVLARCLIFLYKIKKVSVVAVIVAIAIIASYTYWSFKDVQYWRNPKRYYQMSETLSLGNVDF
jgi:hypothetical protein